MRAADGVEPGARLGVKRVELEGESEQLRRGVVLVVVGEVLGQLDELATACLGFDEARTRALLERLVPEFRSHETRPKAGVVRLDTAG